MNWLISFSSTTADWVFAIDVTRLKHFLVATDVETDVLLAEQTRGVDRGKGVLRGNW